MKACAYVVGPDDGPGTALKELARQIGFESVMPYRSIQQAEQQSLQTPLIFFLFSAVSRPRKMQPMADAIRQSESRRVRFSPMIYFSENPSLATIRSCIEMGFDDVITLPFTLARIVERLQRQVEKPVVYFETATYFGPDRHVPQNDQQHAGRGSGGQYRRLEILRSAHMGINVLKDDKFPVAPKDEHFVI